MAKIVEIPVFTTADYDTVPIGKLIVDDDALPKDHRFWFSIAYRLIYPTDDSGQLVKGDPKREILYIHPISDDDCYKFLKHDREWFLEKEE